MEWLLYIAARGLVAFLQALPLTWVARLGRAGGALAWWLDARHRRVAVRNLAMCFGTEKSPAEIRALARENFQRLGENFGCSVKTSMMTSEQLRPHFDFLGAGKILPFQADAGPQNRVVALGHFGNFDLYGHFREFFPAFQTATTYRGIRQPSLNRLMQSLRERSGSRFYERRTEGAAVKAAMNDTGLMLGLLADQNAGPGGLRLPFLGHDCSASAAPAIFAQRYHCPLYTAICYRVGLARWRIEVGDEIPTVENGRPRSIEAVTRDINRALETAVRRDPANWFWVHDRWKQKQFRERPARDEPSHEPVA